MSASTLQIVASSLQTVVHRRGCLLPVAWILICGTLLEVSSQCTVPADLQDTWHRASDGRAITLTPGGMQGHQLKVGSTPYYDFLCARSHGDGIFIFSLGRKVDGVAGQVMGYFCWQLTPLTHTTFLLYQRTPVASSGSFNADRAVSSPGNMDTVPSVSVACSLDPASLHPTLLYRLSSNATTDVNVTSLEMAEQQCPPELLATYSYIKDDTGCTGKNSRLDFCVDRKTAWVNYTTCNVSILFTGSGVLSCVASFKLHSATYVLLVNHDDSVDDVNYFRFACLKLEKNGESEKAVVYPRDCTATSGSHTLSLSRTASCPIGDDKNNIIAIAVGVAVSVFIIIVVVVVIIVVCIKFSKKRTKKIHPAPIPPRENDPEPTDKGVTDISINITEPSSSSTGENPMIENERGIGGRLPPLSLDMEKSAPLRA